MTSSNPQVSYLLLLGACRRFVGVPFGIGAERPGVDDRRRDLIPVLRLAFGLYLQRRELDKGAPSEAGDLARLV